MAAPGERTPQASSGSDDRGQKDTASAVQQAMSTAATVHSQAQSQNPVVPHFGSALNQPFALKLDRNNFTLWRTMVSAIVRGHRLDGYLKGTILRPQEFISTNVDGTEVIT